MSKPDVHPIPATEAVRCSGLTKRFGRGDGAVAALRGIDLTVALGELLMLVGPSGCGKTTLISVIAGILDRDDGECHVFGTDLTRLRAGARTRFRGENIGFVFQAFNLLPAMTAAENVATQLIIRGESVRRSMSKARDALDAVGLADRADAPPSMLSGGQQQRVAIARALVHEPRLVVCDEPTSALDHDTGQSVMRLLRETARAVGRAIVVVTHDARIFPFADRIVRMDDGRIVQPATSSGQDQFLTKGIVHG
jgi:putative ABC transport system ATP-binding protein